MGKAVALLLILALGCGGDVPAPMPPAESPLQGSEVSLTSVDIFTTLYLIRLPGASREMHGGKGGESR